MRATTSQLILDLADHVQALVAEPDDGYTSPQRQTRWEELQRQWLRLRAFIPGGRHIGPIHQTAATVAALRDLGQWTDGWWHGVLHTVSYNIEMVPALADVGSRDSLAQVAVEVGVLLPPKEPESPATEELRVAWRTLLAGGVRYGRGMDCEGGLVVGCDIDHNPYIATCEGFEQATEEDLGMPILSDGPTLGALLAEVQRLSGDAGAYAFSDGPGSAWCCVRGIKDPKRAALYKIRWEGEDPNPVGRVLLEALGNLTSGESGCRCIGLPPMPGQFGGCPRHPDR